MDVSSANKADASSVETFTCGQCGRDFPARIATWVDVSRTPQAKQAILQQRFNIIECTRCGHKSFSGSPFFYEDFEEGVLIAVFPTIPANRGEIEQSIREQYGYYPLLEYFYDTTQLWGFVYLEEYYKTSMSLRTLSRIGRGEERVRAILRFLKENPMMIELREKLTAFFEGRAGDDELGQKLNEVIAELEGMSAWPLDRRCVCGADLSKSLSCCGAPIDLSGHDPHLGRGYTVYCPACKEPVSGIACAVCGRVYAWNRGTVNSYHKSSADRKRNPSP